MKLAIVVGALILLPFVQAQAQDQNIEENDLIRKRLFERLTYTRSWEMGMWRLKFGNETPDIKVQLEKSMVAYAFNYWILAKKKVIDPVPALEILVRKSFLEPV
jgi:hypothetical protein